MQMLIEALIFVSILIIGYGAYLIFPPAGFITVGALLLLFSILAFFSDKPRSKGK